MHGGFFFDRNVPVKAVRALQVLRDDVVGHSEWFRPEERDEVIAQVVADRRHSLVTRDVKMAARPRQRRVLLDAGLHVFINADGGNLGTWDFFVLLVKNFAAMETIAKTEQPAIFFYSRATAPYLRYFLQPDGQMASAARHHR